MLRKQKEKLDKILTKTDKTLGIITLDFTY